MIKYPLTLLLLVYSLASHGEEILRSVEYSVSPDMTLNEARSNAIKQLRMTILSEVGVLVEAKIKSSIEEHKSSETVNYSSLIAGNISLEVIDEIYDGHSLFVNVRAEIKKSEISEVLSRVYKFTEFEKLLRVLERKENNINVLESENKLLKAKLNIIKGQVRYIEKVGTISQEIKSKLLDIKNNIENAKKMATNRINTEDSVASEYIKLSNELFTRGMLYSEFSDVIEVVDIREYYGNATGTSCHYPKNNRKALYMITKKTIDYSEYMYGIEVDQVSKKITRIGFFKPRYDNPRRQCRVSYVGVSMESILAGN